MTSTRLRDPARRAEAERYIRSSRSKLRFWTLSCLAFPVVNAVVLLGVVGLLRPGRGGDGQDTTAFWIVAALLATAEAALLHRLARVFAPRTGPRWVAAAVALTAALTLAFGTAIFFLAWMLTGSDPS
jgi:hypothetical protein